MQNSERIKNLNDDQLNDMINQVRSNKEAIKNVYRAQGIEMSDEQIENMQKMMNPELIKTASQMLASNPELAKNIP